MSFRFNLAHALSSADKWDRAVAEYREAVRLFPADYATQYNLALALYKKGDAAAAVSEFERAIALAQTRPPFISRLDDLREARPCSRRRA